MVIFFFFPTGQQTCSFTHSFCHITQTVCLYSDKAFVLYRSEHVRESKFATPTAWYQQQFCGYRYSGAFLRSDLHWLWLLSLQTKVCAKNDSFITSVSSPLAKDSAPTSDSPPNSKHPCTVSKAQ